MAEVLTNLGALKEATTQSGQSPASSPSMPLPNVASMGTPARVYEQKLDAKGRAYATGKRKNAIARVWIKPGSGKISVNGRTGQEYFGRAVLQMLIDQPFQMTNRTGQYDVLCTVKGGGLSGQAGALRQGLSKALVFYEPDLRPILKRGGFLTRDSRIVERKKYGHPKARKRFQFSKR